MPDQNSPQSGGAVSSLSNSIIRRFSGSVIKPAVAHFNSPSSNSIPTPSSSSSSSSKFNYLLSPASNILEAQISLLQSSLEATLEANSLFFIFGVGVGGALATGVWLGIGGWLFGTGRTAKGVFRNDNNNNNNNNKKHK